MKKVIVWLVVIVLVIWAIVSFSGNNTQQQSNQNTSQAGTDTGPIKIGFLIPLTGDGAVYGEPAKNIYQIAIDEINKSGGINGRQIQAVIEDSKCVGEGGVNAAEKLVNVEGVKVIIGGLCSSETLAAIPVAEKGSVAILSSAASSPDLTGKSPIFFRDYPSDSAQGITDAETAWAKGYKKVAFIQEQLDYPLGVYKSFSGKFESLGGVVVKEEFPTNTKDFRSQIAKLKSQNPDALFVDGQTPASMDIILAQLSQSGWKVPIILNDVGIGTAGTVSKYKNILEGAIGAEFGIDLNNTKFKHLLDAYKTAYGVDMPYQSYGQTEYDAVFIIRDAIAAVGYDGQKIADWGHQLKDWQGASGMVNIGSDGDRTGGHRAEIIKDGKVEAYVK